VNRESRPSPEILPVDQERIRPHGALGAGRRNELRALGQRVAELQRRLAVVRDGARGLAEIEAGRRLTPPETRRARDLRWESEHLRFELQLLRERFEALASGT
jgi:hypothetical protein